MDDPPLTPTGIHTTFDMAIDATGEVAGSASISATFTLTGAQRFHRVFQNGVQKGIFNDINVAGTLTATSGAATYSFDLAGCIASTMSRMDQIHDPTGPKPGGAVPANEPPLEHWGRPRQPTSRWIPGAPHPSPRHRVA